MRTKRNGGDKLQNIESVIQTLEQLKSSQVCRNVANQNTYEGALSMAIDICKGDRKHEENRKI